jgi:uncharacterized membrane protein
MYGVVLLLSAISYIILQYTIMCSEGANSALRKALNKDYKGKISLVLYVIGIVTAFFNQWVSGAAYFTVAMLWLIPDKRIGRIFS